MTQAQAIATAPRFSAELGEDAARALNRLIWYSFLVRVVLLALLEWTGYSRRLAPDEQTYDEVGWAVSLFWSGDSLTMPYQVIRGDTPSGYFYVNAVFFYLFGHTALPVKIANALLGAFTGRYIYLLARALFGDAVAMRAATLFLFFPSLILWSTLNLRDTSVVFLVVFVSWTTSVLLDEYSLGTLLKIVAALFGLSQFRDHLFYAVSAPPLISLLIGRRGNLGRNLLVALVLSIPILALLQHGAVSEKTHGSLSLEALSEIRQKMATGGSSFAPDVDISTPGGVISFLPVGLAYFFFSPFPWQISSALKLISVPEMLLVYYLTLPTLRGIRYAVKHRLREALQVLLVTGLLTLTYALGEGNVGTLYRHRAQAMGFYLIFAAVGLEIARAPKVKSKAALEAA